MAAFDTVFASTDPFGTPFQPSVAQKALLFPVSCALKEAQLEALASAAAVVGEHEAYSVCTEDQSGETFEISLGDFATYDAAMRPSHGVLENAVFSQEGTWGLLFSCEHHVLAGGPTEFVETLLDHFPRSEEAPQTIHVTPDIEPFTGTDIDDIAAHYLNQGAHATEPLVGLVAREQVGSFVAEWRRERDDWGHNIEWLPRLLEHLYGAEESQNLMLRAGLRSER